MDYQETLDYLYAQLPMFHRIGAAAYKADLKNTLAICDLLDHPEKKIKFIHVAGTNGKGSVSHMLAAVLQTAGYKTGLYTSPHLKDFRERIRLDGEMIPEKNVIAFVEKYKNDFEKIQPSFFEWTVGLAFDYFASERVDIAVIETGLGGRLDATNVIIPELSIITNIGKDHQQLLGDTIQKIAEEKAGIIKRNIPVVIGQTQDEVKDIFILKAREEGSAIYFSDANFSAQSFKSNQFLEIEIKDQSGRNEYYRLDLTGIYQAHNLITVLQSVEVLKWSDWKVEPHHLKDALMNVRTLTGLAGRWQKISDSPAIVCDVAHNEDGIREVLRCIEITPHQKLHIVFGTVADKTLESVLSLLPKDASYYFCKADIPRALNVEELKKKAEQFGIIGKTYQSVQEALSSAKQFASKDDLIVVTGSTFVVGEVLTHTL